MIARSCKRGISASLDDNISGAGEITIRSFDAIFNKYSDPVGCCNNTPES